MASSNATTVLEYLSDSPGEQDKLAYTAMKLLETYGTDGDEQAVDDVITQLESTFDADSAVMEEIKTQLTAIRLKVDSR